MYRMLFQFHKGAIRTNRLLQEQFKAEYFNSIKVRLEHAMAEAFVAAGNAISIP